MYTVTLYHVLSARYLHITLHADNAMQARNRAENEYSGTYATLAEAI